MNERVVLKQVAERMRARRRDAQLTQSKVAEAVGVNQPRVSRWESARAVPSVIELIRFAVACNMRPEHFLSGIVVPSIEQLGLELDPEAGTIVGELVQLLHDRPPPTKPTATEPIE